MPTDNIENELRAIALRSDVTIRRKLFEYLELRELLIELTGVEQPYEATLIDILPIQDETQRRRAAVTARRMRRLIRETFPYLKE